MNEAKASRYHRLRRRAVLLTAAWAVVWLAVLVLSGLSSSLGRATALAASGLPSILRLPAAVSLWALVVVAVYEAGALPLAWYAGFALERRYGLSRQRAPEWLTDHLKAAALRLVFTTAAAVWVAAWLERWPGGWWLAAWLGAVAASVGIAWAAPVLLLPLFYRFVPMADARLRQRLLALAARAGTPAIDILEWRLSDRTSRANAAVTGLGRTRRIVVSDTLVADYEPDEVEVVVAHELAHHVRRDARVALAVQAAIAAAAFLLSDAVLRAASGPLGLAGGPASAGLPVVALVVLSVEWMAAPVVNAVSRAHERRADRFAIELTGNAAAFGTAMRRLGAGNLAEETPGALARAFFHTHPLVGERLAAARSWEAERAAARATGGGT